MSVTEWKNEIFLFKYNVHIDSNIITKLRVYYIRNIYKKSEYTCVE